MSSSLRHGLLANHSDLVGSLDPATVARHLVQKGIVTLDERERIMKKDTRSEGSEEVLMLVHRNAVLNEGAYESFLEMLADDDGCGKGQQLKDLVTKIRDDAAKPEVVAMFQAKPTQLNARQNAALQREASTLVASLNVEELIPDLVSNGVLSLDDTEKVRAGATCNEKVEQLVSLLYEKNEEQFDRFATILKAKEGYQDIAKRLLKKGEEKNRCGE